MSKPIDETLYSDSDSDEVESVGSSEDNESTGQLEEQEQEEEQEEEQELEEEEKDEDQHPEEYIQSISGGSGEGEDDDDDDDHPYLQKFNAEINKNYIVDFHPECCIHNYDEINTFTRIVRDKHNNVIDDLHRTIPFLTKYERTRIIGQRAKQLNSGAKAFVQVPENTIDGYLIAELELAQKRIPFILRRPIPGGGFEYWNVKDLEIVSF
jgi:DNA-directed RNA polymerase I, II, and III subunit RPABC2